MSSLVNAFNRLSSSLLIVWLTMAICTAFLVSNVVVGFKNVEDLDTLQKGMENTSELILAIDNLHIASLNAESSTKSYLLTKESSTLGPLLESLTELDENIARVTAEKSESLPQQKRIKTYLNTAILQVSQLKQHADKASEDKQSALALVRTIEKTALDLRQQYNRILEEETAIRDIQRNFLNNVKREAISNIVWFSFISISLVLLTMALVFKNLRDSKRAEVSLSNANADLEEKVQARTAKLQLLADELNKSNRELEDFAFVASHDLQEPLRKIQAFSDRLENSYRNELDDRGRDYLMRMKNAAARMSLLINDLLALSRVATKRKPFVTQPLKPIVDGALDDLEVVIEETKANIQIASLPTVSCDDSQLRQLFFNLIANALKFRKSNVVPEISIAEVPTDDPQSVCILVKDNGIGFDPQYEEKIFSPFQRLHERSEYPGTGIGLTLCRRIVERHGGVITSHSEVGIGASFYITLQRDIQPTINTEIPEYE